LRRDGEVFLLGTAIGNLEMLAAAQNPERTWGPPT
jgi:hypothetical protein